MKQLPAWFSGAIGLGAFLALSWFERRRDLRARVESQVPHVARNLAIAGLGAVALQIAERPVVGQVASLVERRGWGLLKRTPLPAAVEIGAAVVLMDYTLYLWHVLAHRVPVLWRAHAVHHADRDLDATTALRFHFAELLASVPWRCAQVAAIGVSPRALSIWQTSLFTSILFHHSNLKLPVDVERRLAWVVVTPRMHGIHHSRSASEVNSNWSSGLTIWDWLHGSLKLNVPQAAVPIGVPGFDTPDDVALAPMIGLPFSPKRPPVGDASRHDDPSVPATTLLP